MARGELRVYMGAAPGVGKTFAMLNEGWRRRERGTDVVVAYVETHGRANTAAQVRDLEVVPRRLMEYRGQTFEEMDLDAVLARRPQLALVDELAHTNVPGSRHEKRWQDIDELLEAGIDVISTVNIQHLESLNDVVQRITGVVQRETVPDAVVRAADQIELVDMTPEALRRRMAHGNIYAAEKVDSALGHYFRVGNLGALRELALLWVADRVDEGLQDYRERHGLVEPWETRERVVVALTGAPGGDRLIRRGARLAGRSGAELMGVHVRSVDGLAGPSEGLLEQHRVLLDELDGTYAEVASNDTADALVRFSLAENATQLILGSSRRSRWAELTRGSVINRVIRSAGPIDVHVISLERSEGQPAGSGRGIHRSAPARPPRMTLIAWIVALVGVPALAAVLIPLEDELRVQGVLLVLLLGPVAAALIGGMYPALVAALVAFLAADWWFIDPRRSLRFDRAGDAAALAVFIVVAALVSALVDRLAGRTAQFARGQAEAETLARLASGTGALDREAVQRLVHELRATLGLDAVAVLSPDGDGWAVEASAGEPVPMVPERAGYSAELSSGWVLVVSGGPLPAEDHRLLAAFVSQLRLAQSTLELRAQAARADSLSEANDVRDAILASVSHDLRGPLANIKVAASSLSSDEIAWSPEDTKTFCSTIDAEVDRLHGVIANLLDLGRLQAGVLPVQLGPVVVEEVVDASLASLARDTSIVDVDLPPDLPLALADAGLLERALANVIDNAMRWAPAGTRVRVGAGAIAGRVDIRVVDRGAGIPRDRREAAFEPFQRLGDSGPGDDGVGLGLAVTKGFVDAMRGEVTIEDTPGGGATLVIDLEAVT
jgi:two-component system sensor histidine kinase KdpD